MFQPDTFICFSEFFVLLSYALAKLLLLFFKWMCRSTYRVCEDNFHSAIARRASMASGTTE